ncbi:MAG: hypothetical protein JO332_10545 [Planctomycetaceae bacterium]|nr:hypothetical protein [Planctomycetaceae bacterium]
MAIAGLLVLTATLFDATGPDQGLKPVTFETESRSLKLWLPESYEPARLVARKYERKPTVTNPEAITLRVTLLPTKLPETPAPPHEADVMKLSPLLTDLKVTGSLAPWRGRPVAVARYEGFVQGKVGVYGRMVWLPLDPGTVVLDLYAEPAWMAAMDQDWNSILANIEGSIAERTLRERAPRRWLAAKITVTLGILVTLAGVVIILARMNDALGGAVVYLGLLLPVIPVGYAFLHRRECWRGLLAVGSGLAIVGVALLLEG